MIEFNATIIVAMLSFVVFMFIMNAIFYKPILNIIKKRDDYIKSNYDEARKNSDQAKMINEKHEQQLKDAKDSARKQNFEIIEEEQRDSFEKLQKAKESSKIEMQNRKESIVSAKNEIQEEINKSVVSDLAELISTKMLNKG